MNPLAALNGLDPQWRSRHLSVNSQATPTGLSGECGTLRGFPTASILALLEPGEALPPVVREEMEAAFDSGFGRVRLHTGFAAQLIAEKLGAEAFTIGNHVVFRRGRFQPHFALGWELLRHELAHTLEADGREDRIYGWFTLLLNSRTHTYRLGGQAHQIVVGGGNSVKTHETITREALDNVGGYGAGARRIIGSWVAEIDRWKKREPSTLSNLASRRSSGSAQPDFPQLSAIIRAAGSMNDAVDLLHAYGAQNSAPGAGDIGMTSLEVDVARLTGRGIVGSLLDEAVTNFNNGHHDHALRLLGISLHTIQDFYSHKVPLCDQVAVESTRSSRVLSATDLRVLGLREGGQENVSILEDDPSLDPRRCLNARLRTAEQLRMFVQRLQPAKKTTLTTM